ncbi:MAG: ketopantoate reductase family protein [Candidatus Thiodiazotropha sp. (ex Cardiolucina cf. quadrata)]|nr:ketopantoate reductase family protein [Candidatus Thiodiazotropha sp. (ex Cardiolucina cf. quadrata)]
MRVLILGAGGIGCYLGCRLDTVDCDTTFLVREIRVKELETKGISLYSELGDVHIKPKIVTEESVAGQFDIIILSCKAYDLNSAIKSVRPHLDEETVVIPFLNGVAHLELLDAELGHDRIAGGVAHLAVTQKKVGVIQHLNNIHKFTVGSRHDSQKHKIEQLSSSWSKANLDFSISNYIEQDIWDKFVFLSTLAGATCTMRSSIGTILETSYGENYIVGLLNECINVAEANSHEPNEHQLTSYRSQLTEKGSTYTASMLRDIRNNSKIEGEHVIGDMVKRAIKQEITIPFLEIAYSHIQAYELERMHNANA